MKVAIVHDYLVNRGGAERVVLALHRMWPYAPIHTSLYHPEATYDEFRGADVRVSPLQRLSKDPARFRRLLPLFPRAFASFDLGGYDLVISSSSGFAHHVRVPEGTCHVVYSYSPPRFLWDDGYALAGVAPWWARPTLPPVRAWLRRRDRAAARRPHFYLAVSGVAAKRLRGTYGRASTVVHPPVEVERYRYSPVTGDYHLLVGRLLPYRNAGLAVRAFSEMGRRLIVVGDGPARASLEAMAGPTIEFRGVVSDEDLVALYGSCRGVVVPGEEDFGLTPLEANASGRPAIALGQGGALETVVDGLTGVLFARPTEDSLARALVRAESLTFDPRVLRHHALRYSEDAFAERVRAFADHASSSCLECVRTRRGRARASGRAAALPVEMPAAEEA